MTAPLLHIETRNDLPETADCVVIGAGIVGTNLADGRVFSGRQAKERGLIDALGAEPEARQWLAKTHDIDAALPVIEMVIEHEDEPWRDMIQGLIGKALFSERLRLDGGISLWHPDLY